MANIFYILGIFCCISYTRAIIFPLCGNSEVLNLKPKPCTFDPTCEEVINGTITICNIIPKFILPRCECKPGLVRIGINCLPPQKCCKDPNEVLVSCPTNCDNTCIKSWKPNECILKPCNKFGCKCKDGYVRNEIGVCIPVSSCPPICSANEVLNMCPQYCTFDKTCEEIINGFIRDCPPPPKIFPCTPRCECKPGYVRIGRDCVPQEKCCSKPNEVLVLCPADCDNTCKKSWLPGKCALKPCSKYGCKCKIGYVRDVLTGNCIHPKFCH